LQQKLRDSGGKRIRMLTANPFRSLKSKAQKKHGKEYKKARERYPSPEY